MTEPKQIYWRFDDSFPDCLYPRFDKAMEVATKMWEKSGLVQFNYKMFQDKVNPESFRITWELLGNEYGDITKSLSLPEISWKDPKVHDLYAHQTKSLVVNCAYDWRTKWYQFFRKEFNPIVIAHNIGHLLGLCHKKHVRNIDSVMFEKPISPPSEYDFQILRISLANQEHKKGKK